MMAILQTIHDQPSGSDISDIVKVTKIPRSTVYRILNTLVDHGMVARQVGKSYVLGKRLLGFAAAIDSSISPDDLVAEGADIIEALALKTLETCKLSILRENRAEVVAVAQSPNDLAPTSRAGSQFMLHAGAASKLLLAFASPALVDTVFDEGLPAYTDKTLTTRKQLISELSKIKISQLSFDRGEWNANVHAIAAPVFGFEGNVIAAISATRFASEDDKDIDLRVVKPLQSAARELSIRFGWFESSVQRD